MKLKINKKYQEVDFWSFVKCHLLAYLTLVGLASAATLVLYSLI
jgi:hypothetical protein